MRQAIKQNVPTIHVLTQNVDESCLMSQVLAGNPYKETGKRPLYQQASPLLLCMFYLPASFGTS